MTIRKAVFPVAGFGTRFLPATKAMPKELLPIIDKPLIQFAVEEAISAGLDTLIFVTGRNKRAIEDHFDGNLELENQLRKIGKSVEADMVKNILPKDVECIFVRQKEQLGLGHAVLCAERAVGKEPFAVLLADDLMISKVNNTTKELIEAFEITKKNQLAVKTINNSSISNYGVIDKGENPRAVKGMVEKPKYDLIPSNLASIGRYVFNYDIFDILKKQKLKKGAEIQLTDAIDTLAKRNEVEAIKTKNIRFDCGSKNGYLDAIKFASKNWLDKSN